MLELDKDRDTLNGDGTKTSFDFDFYIQKDTDIEVYLINETTKAKTKKTLTSEYTVTDISSVDPLGFTVNFVGYTPTTNERVFVIRKMPITQLLNLAVVTDFDERKLMYALDKIVAILQQQGGDIDRTIKVADESALTGITLPASLTPGRALVVNSAGNNLELSAGSLMTTAGGAIGNITVSDNIPILVLQQLSGAGSDTDPGQFQIIGKDGDLICYLYVNPDKDVVLQNYRTGNSLILSASEGSYTKSNCGIVLTRTAGVWGSIDTYEDGAGKRAGFGFSKSDASAWYGNLEIWDDGKPYFVNSTSKSELMTTAGGTFTSHIALNNTIAVMGVDTADAYCHLLSMDGSNIVQVGTSYAAHGLQLRSSIDPTYYNGSSTYTLLHTGNFASSIEARHYVGAAGEPAFLNSWVNHGSVEEPANFYKDNQGFVHLEGMVKSGTMGLAIFGLPEGYRPTYDKRIATCSYNGSAVVFGSVIIDDSGAVIPDAGANIWFSLSGISFRV